VTSSTLGELGRHVGAGRFFGLLPEVHDLLLLANEATELGLSETGALAEGREVGSLSEASRVTPTTTPSIRATLAECRSRSRQPDRPDWELGVRDRRKRWCWAWLSFGW